MTICITCFVYCGSLSRQLFRVLSRLTLGSGFSACRAYFHRNTNQGLQSLTITGFGAKEWHVC